MMLRSRARRVVVVVSRRAARFTTLYMGVKT
jgi:hypothetical protein